MIPKRDLFVLATTLEGIPILGTLTGTPAARVGLRYGDVLLSVNGMRTRTVIDYLEAKELRRDGMEIVVFRNGAEHREELIYDQRTKPVDLAAILAELVSMRIAGDEPVSPADDESS